MKHSRNEDKQHFEKSKIRLTTLYLIQLRSLFSIILLFFLSILGAAMETLTQFGYLTLPHHLLHHYTLSDRQMEQEESAQIRERGNHLKMQVSDLQAFKWHCQMTRVKSFPPSFALIKVASPKQNICLADLNNRNFAVLAYPVHSLILFAQQILRSHPERQSLCSSFDLGQFTQVMAEKYYLNAYHNFSHAFSVQMMLYQLYNRSSKIRSCLTQTQWFYAFIAALAHDLSHPGTNNSLENRMNSKIAQVADHTSVLQKYHLSQFWKIGQQSKSMNLFAGVTKAEAKQCKRLITRLIMATDITRHHDGFATLREINKKGGSLHGQRAIEVVEQLFHACDIGNPCLDFDNYINWGALVSYQFDQISSKQESLGFEVTPGLKHGSISQFYKQQKGFCDYLVLPLWKQLSVTFKQVGEYSVNIEKNMKKMEQFEIKDKQ